MIPDFMYSLKDEKLYYEISNNLIELWELNKEINNKLPKLERPILDNNKPTEGQVKDYLKDLFKYQKEWAEYNQIKNKLDNSKEWKDLINNYVSQYYISVIPIVLIEKFIFNKYKHKPYADIFEAYVEMLDWFEENNIMAVEKNNG